MSAVMFERPAAGDAALLVHLDFGAESHDERLRELELLAASAGARILGVVRGRRQRPDPALFAGRGKVHEIGEQIATSENSGLRPSTTGVYGLQPGPLDVAMLKAGSVLYRRATGQVSFRLLVYPKEGVSVTQSVEWRAP